MAQWIQNTDPGSNASAFDEWDNPDTGDIYYRKADNSGWVYGGNVNDENLGFAPVSGFDATGAITGVSGWAPVDSPNFTTSARLENIDLATINDLNDVKNLLITSINSRITSAITNYQKKMSVSDRYAMDYGILTFAAGTSVAQTIPLPIFASDGVKATQAQSKWIVAPINFMFYDSTARGANNEYMQFIDSSGNAVDPSQVRTFIARTFNVGEDAGSLSQCVVMYFIMATR